jgi:hypothetical protein
MVNEMDGISSTTPVTQEVLPLTNGNGGLHPPEPNGSDASASEPVRRPKKGAKRYSRARYDNLIADLVVQPRNVDAVLDAIERYHPILYLPHDLRRRVQIAGLARRLCALGATAREVLDWMAKFSSPSRV